MTLPVVGEIARMKEWQPDEAAARGQAIIERIEEELETLR
jgi:hypothetical protein